LEGAKWALVRGLFPCALVGGARAARYAERLGILNDRIALGYDVVDNAFFSQAVDRIRETARPSDFQLPNGFFLFVGRLAAEKNLDTLLRAFSLYQARGGARSLAIVGRGPMEGHLRQEVRRLGVEDKVTLYGSRRPEELLPFYSFACCLVLPSISEPWGLVVNEAMASGLPVVVSEQCGCVEDLVEPGSNGFVFDPHDEVGLAACLLQIEGITEQGRRAMGVRSRAIVAQYSPSRFAMEVESLWKKVEGSRRWRSSYCGCP
jgi:glycosyltransferase involved in cell wall biosynthesis